MDSNQDLRALPSAQIKAQYPKLVTIGNFECWLQLKQNNIHGRLVSKISDDVFDWVLKHQDFSQNTVLVCLYQSIDNFLEQIIQEPTVLSIDDNGHIKVKIVLNWGSTKSKTLEFEFIAEKVNLTENEHLKIIVERLSREKKKLEQRLNTLEPCSFSSLPSKKALKQVQLAFTPNTAQVFYDDFEIKRTEKLFAKKIGSSKWSRLLNNRSLTSQPRNIYFYSFTVGMQPLNFFQSSGDIIIGFYQTSKPTQNIFEQQKNILGTPPFNQPAFGSVLPSQTQMLPLKLLQGESFYFIGLSLATMKVVSKLNDNSVSSNSSEKINVEMQVDTQNGKVEWFVNDFYVAKGKLMYSQSKQWFSCVFIQKIGDYVVFN